MKEQDFWDDTGPADRSIQFHSLRGDWVSFGRGRTGEWFTVSAVGSSGRGTGECTLECNRLGA